MRMLGSSKFKGKNYLMEILKLYITMGIFMKGKYRETIKAVGALTFIAMDRNIVEYLSMMKFMVMEGITFYREHNMKGIGVVG